MVYQIQAAIAAHERPPLLVEEGVGTSQPYHERPTPLLTLMPLLIAEAQTQRRQTEPHFPYPNANPRTCQYKMPNEE